MAAEVIMGVPGIPTVVPHIDFDTPTGNPQAAARIGYGLTRPRAVPAYVPPAPPIPTRYCTDGGKPAGRHRRHR